VERPISADLAQVEANDPVERCERFVLQLVEHASRNPFVAA
jgi:hypothetical protein